jgi:hypothetical protein
MEGKKIGRQSHKIGSQSCKNWKKIIFFISFIFPSLIFLAGKKNPLGAVAIKNKK